MIPLDDEENVLKTFINTTLEEDNENEFDGSRKYKLAFWTPRILGTITVVSAACMVWTAWKRREHIFHRLILGTSINLLVQGAFFVYGVAAFPEDDVQDFPKGYGSIATCNIQGFFIQFCAFSTMFYYSLFSVYSYLCVLNNFQVSRFAWVEKYIHISAPLFPLASAVVSLILEAYNPTSFGFCTWSTRMPMLCESPGGGDAKCERGSPQTIYHLMFIIAEIFCIVIPTSIMVALYWKVKGNQSKIRLQAACVANQAFVYLFMLYWVNIPLILMEILIWISNKKNLDDEIKYIVYVAVFNSQSIGFLTLMVYRYFSTGTYYREETIVGKSSRRKSVLDSANDGSSSMESGFNIFDGSGAGSAFAEFIFNGDEEDKAIDEQETRHWSGMQGL